MWVKEAELSDFRNFRELSAALSPGINLVCGDNANGKTNFIEAIFFCATGRSPRVTKSDELIRFGRREAHIKLSIEDGRAGRIDFHVFDGKKSASIDRVPIRKISELFGILLVVSFMPEDLSIVKGSPSTRRIFLDTELCQISRTYYRFLKRYYQALKQRNSLLKAIPRDSSLKDSLFVWDAPLSEAGTKITEYRRAFVAQLNEYASAIHAQITDGKELLNLEYRPNITDDYAARLARNIERDIMLGATSAGIHKDDITFEIDEKNARVFGSQGQQRTTALSTKLATIELIKARTKYSPVLLLDDVLSELDASRQRFLLGNLRDLQTVITCTGAVPGLRADRVFTMVDGEISTGYNP